MFSRSINEELISKFGSTILLGSKVKKTDMETPVINEIVTKIKTLPENLHRQVLIFVDALHVSSRRGSSAKMLLQYVGTISPDDLSTIKEAIESGCEQVG